MCAPYQPCVGWFWPTARSCRPGGGRTAVVTCPGRHDLAVESGTWVGDVDLPSARGSVSPECSDRIAVGDAGASEDPVAGVDHPIGARSANAQVIVEYERNSKGRPLRAGRVGVAEEVPFSTE